jgi:predicted dehydrogenase
LWGGSATPQITPHKLLLIQNPKSKIQNPKSKIQNPKSKISPPSLPMSSSSPICWGILGTGAIAKAFAQDLNRLPDAELRAIASRDLSTAQGFATQFDVLRAYGSYEELVQDPEIDVVYIATPHVRHKQDVMMCLEAGKAVLCEKPFALNAQESREMIALARQKQVFCMEAMWMRFMPLVQQVREWVQAGKIGEVRSLTANFGYPVAFDANSRFFSPELGGGTLLDRGIYPLSLAFYLLGVPSQVTAAATLATTGVDVYSAMQLSYGSGATAVIYSTMRQMTSNEVWIEGTKGVIQIHAPFYKPYHISLLPEGERVVLPTTLADLDLSASEKPGLTAKLKQKSIVQKLDSVVGRFVPSRGVEVRSPISGEGYGYEAMEVMQCLRSGRLESGVMPLDETLQIMETMDQVRQQIGVKYPQEK